MGISMNAITQQFLGFQLSSSRTSVRTLTEEDIEEKRKKQRLAECNAKANKPMDGTFFLEYFRYRDKPVAHSLTKMNEIMAKSKTDDLSKAAPDEEKENTVESAMIEAANELGISVEQLTLTVEQAGRETTAFSDVLKALLGLISQKQIEDKFESKQISKDDSDKDWATRLREFAKGIDESANSLEIANATTGNLPNVDAFYAQAEIFRNLADLAERAQTAGVSGTESGTASQEGLTEQRIEELKQKYDVTNISEQSLADLLSELEQAGAITQEERESAQMTPMFVGIIESEANRTSSFTQGDICNNLRSRISLENAQLGLLSENGLLLTDLQQQLGEQIGKVKSNHENLLHVLEKLS